MERKRMLIADDQIATREALAKFAKLEGYDVVAVTNGVELLETVSRERFDVVITDLVMPGMNGVSAAELIRARGVETPIVALTGLPLHDVQEAYDGFAKIYHKPVNASSLMDDLEALLQPPSN
ncbi:response regulator [Geomesophilobacter sediminis]|uniref:Response regulator n=1 Tax=Geomesophilobacter sediminis TaxID=2798584 RepID=A0A8J7LY18_9BACT|nr:response regulator [Geomesophilobacter sediminis]MBJ6724126.1 response regulator [Geomesophilobacter sediminis]